MLDIIVLIDVQVFILCPGKNGVRWTFRLPLCLEGSLFVYYLYAAGNHMLYLPTYCKTIESLPHVPLLGGLVSE
jgi:hypothetical protein